MKRIWIWAVVLCLVVSLAACSGEAGNTTPTGTTTAPTTAGETDTTTAGGDTVTPPTGSNGTTTPTTQKPTTQKPTTTTTQLVVSGEELFAGTTVMDNANCLIKITEVDEKAENGYTLHLHLENRTSKYNLLFSVDGGAVNGVQTDTLFATEVAAGEATDEMIVLGDIAPEGVNIGTYSDILLMFSVSDVDNWSAPPIAQVNAHIYPVGEKYATTHTHMVKSTDRVLLDNEYVKVIALGSAENTVRGYYYTTICLKNKTDEPLVFSLDNATLNGLAVSPHYGVQLMGGYTTYGKVIWLNDTLSASNISAVEQITFDFCAYTEQEYDPDQMEEDDWEMTYLVKEPITYKP